MILLKKHGLVLLDLFIKLGPFVFTFMEYLTPMLNSSLHLDVVMDQMNMGRDQDKVFDFIVVGAGSSGCHLVAKLSQRYKVLLLEAGGEQSPLLSMPIHSYFLSNQKPVDWAHRTVPQTHAAFGLKNNVSFWPQGKLLGGSSSINGMIYLRGHVQGFDVMANKTNNPRWRMENILRYYKKLENYDGWFKSGGEHGRNGPTTVEKAFLTPMTKYMLKANEELGYLIRDSNAYGPYTDGAAPMEFHMRFGRRADAYHTAVEPILLYRPNLVLRKYALVTKVLMNGKTAYGVQYERHGRKYKAFARKEVILSAGALWSPKLLMLSGIGPKSHLKSLGIPLIVDLPVGERLQDKYGALVGPFILQKPYSFNRERDLTFSSMLDWLFNGKGPIAGGRTEATHAITTSVAHRREPRDVIAPDIHTYVIAASADSRTKMDYGNAFNFNEEALDYISSSRGQDSFFQLVTLTRPRGVGNVKLRNKDPKSPVLIDPKYLQNSMDVETLVEGIKFSVKLVEKTKAFKRIGGHLMNKGFPGCEHHLFKSDAYYECIARHATITAYKYTGTAPMGSSNDPEAVVDSNLKVHGVNRLRVIDGSIFQLKYTAENDVTCRMLGELGADIILDYWKNT